MQRSGAQAAKKHFYLDEYYCPKKGVNILYVCVMNNQAGSKLKKGRSLQ